MIRSGRTHILHCITFIAAGAAAFGVASTATAFQNRTGCYASTPTWNAPKGAIVSGKSLGPINAVLTAVGESRTHTMISNGTWATHSTTLEPSVFGTIPNAAIPLNPVELAQGQPGLSQIPMGGAFAYWLGAQETYTQVIPPPPFPQIFCGDGCKAQAAADWLWADVPYQQVRSASNDLANAVALPWPFGSGTGHSVSYFYSLGFNDANGTFRHLPYGFYQYRWGVDKVQGADVESVDDNGIVCSQTPAWAYAHWIAKPDRLAIVPGTETIETHQYSHDDTVKAATALVRSVYDECRNADSGFFADIVKGLLNVDQNAICKGAAYQVLNCFLMGETGDEVCADSSTAPLASYTRNTRARGANSLSPDTLMGLSGRPRTGSTVGPWANFSEVALQWNGGGSNYGCFW